jgi:hypothetical protein
MKVAEYKWAIIDDVIVGVGSEGAMPDDVWKSFVNDLSTKPIKKYLSVIVGAIEVNSTQRKMGIEAVDRRKIKTVAVTDSSIVRGILTAAGWFGVQIRAFPHTQLREAVQELGVPEWREDAIIAAVQNLKASIK